MKPSKTLYEKMNHLACKSPIRRAAALKSAAVRRKGDLSVIRIFTADAEKVRALATARHQTPAEILRDALAHFG